MDTKGYEAPSNVGPTLFVGALTLIYPVLLLRRLLLASNGIQDLPVTWSIFWLVVYVLQLKYHTIPFFTTPLNGLPRPQGEQPVTGHLRGMIKRHKTFLHFTRTVPNDGLIFWRGPLHFTHHILATTPAAMAEVLNTHAYDYQKPAPARRFLVRILGTGLVNAEGSSHKWQRRAVGPAFQPRHVRELVPLFWAKAQQMVDVLTNGNAVGKDRYNRSQPAVKEVTVNEQGRKQVEVEIGGLASRATLDIIGKAGFGTDLNTLENDENELAKQYDLILDPQKGAGARLILYLLINILLPMWLVIHIPWKMNQRVGKAAYKLREVCRELIREKKQALKQEKAQDPEKASQVDIISVLLRKEELDEDGLVNQMLTFLAAGHETTSSALTWVSYLLSANPDVQTRLREELQALQLADPMASVTADLIDSLPYLSAVCAETLRFYPTVPVTARVAIRDTQILGHKIPKGTEVFICPWAINRHPELWKDPDEFQPERWLTPEVGGERAMNGYEFITFLHGPRSCIGQGFARSELKCLVAALVLRFNLELANPGEVPEPAGVVTIKPKNGMRLKLTEISKT